MMAESNNNTDGNQGNNFKTYSIVTFAVIYLIILSALRSCMIFINILIYAPNVLFW